MDKCNIKNWALRFVFFSIFYTCIILLTRGLWEIYSYTIIGRGPKYTLDESLIGSNPGLNFRPKPYNVFSSLIHINISAYKRNYEEDVKDFLKDYEPNENFTICGAHENPLERGCKFPVDQLGPCSPSQFSYSKNEICIYLKLNKIYGWLPEGYSSYDLPSLMPEDLKNAIRTKLLDQPSEAKHSVYISCQGVTPADMDHIGEILYYPDRALNGQYFPYYNSKGYLSPLVAVYFYGVEYGTLINIECKAWAKNIFHSRMDQKGTVQFQLLITK